MDQQVAKGQLNAAMPIGQPARHCVPSYDCPARKSVSPIRGWATFIVAICVAHGSLRAANLDSPLDKQPWRGVVTHVSDGDTVWIRPESDSRVKRATVKIRLDGIDAPESCQPYGGKAKQVLAERLLRKPVLVHPRRVDNYGRLLAKVSLDQPPHSLPDVGAWMVERGHAWSQRYKQDAGPYAVNERRARLNHRGLFAHTGAQRPREFRLEHGSCQ